MSAFTKLLIFFTVLHGSAVFAGVNDDSCFRHVRNMLCESSASVGYNNQSPECDRTISDANAEVVMDAYLKLPSTLKKMMCSLDVFVVVDKHVSIANGFFHRKQDGRSIYGIAFSKHILESRVSFDEILTRYDADLLKYPKPVSKWSEIGTDFSHLIPRFHVSANFHQGFRLNVFFTLAHELGHFLDMVTESSFSYLCVSQKRDEKYCAQKTYPWTDLSWKDFETPSLESGFPENKLVCYYDNHCDQSTSHTKLEDIVSIYKTLSLSNFISLYAVASADEDLADSIAFVALKEAFPKASFEVHIGDDFKYDYLKKLDSDVFSRKRSFIGDLLNKGNVVNRNLLEQKIPL